MRKKTSIIWNIKREDLQNVVSSCSTFSCILKYFNLVNKGGNVRTLKTRLNVEKINYDHIKIGKNSNLGRKFHDLEKKLLCDILTTNSKYNRRDLKKRLISENILEYKCSQCGIGNNWQGNLLTLQLDHINGVSDDNTLSNLRLLCPNCHSQTDTFAGRSLRKKYYCPTCNEEMFKTSEKCNKCAGQEKRKFNPTRQELECLIQSHSMVAVGKIFGVSDNAVRKRCIKFGIDI